jgi:hypothetical protein
MSVTRNETWTVEKQIKTQLAADSALWTDVNSQIFEGAIPLGVSTRNPDRFLIMREVVLPETKRRLSGVVAWDTFDYDVIIATPDETYSLIAGDADRIFTALHNTTNTLDGLSINLQVVQRWKRRYVRDGIVWKELGQRVRALVCDAAVALVRANNHYFVLSHIGPPATFSYNLTPYINTLSVVIGGGVLITVTGYYDYSLSVVNSLPALSVWTAADNIQYVYGPRGSAVGADKLSGGALVLTSFTFSHDGPDKPLMWTAVFKSSTANWGSF